MNEIIENSEREIKFIKNILLKYERNKKNRNKTKVGEYFFEIPINSLTYFVFNFNLFS